MWVLKLSTTLYRKCKENKRKTMEWKDTCVSEDQAVSNVGVNGLTVMFCWGNSSNGELGLGGIEDQHILAPREVQFVHGDSIKKIACGKSHTLLVTESGKVYSCGNNDFGQLGHDEIRSKLQSVEGLDTYKICDVACGESFSVALSEWGEVFSWGSNSHGQLGSNLSTEQCNRPKIVKTLATYHIVQIACGYKHCIALTNQGELYAWGDNTYGQLGLGLKVEYINQPTLITSLVGLPISYITCGADHCFALSLSGAVYGWGKNRFGQLGLNSQVDHIYPCQLKTLRSIRVKYISCGEDFSSFLTQDGGVLTCGAGQNGQLGHGSRTNEILPRTVLELMGSTVTQISCGRRHTLAYIASRHKVYAFGLGGAGQLGTKQLESYPSPQVVIGPWLTDTSLSVQKLFAGGDQSFVTILPYKTASVDYRVHPDESQIWRITSEKMRECESFPADLPVDQDLLKYIETVLSSQSCINGSFLIDNDGHFCCTSKHHGLDIDLAHSCFSALSKASNTSILEFVLSCVTQLIPTFSRSPPDVETLRIYVTLPLYHEFDNAKHASALQGPFAQALIHLKPEAAKIVGQWYYTLRTDYFERLVNIYKDVLLLNLRGCSAIDKQNYLKLNECSNIIMNSLEILSSLNQLNQSTAAQLKVCYETFYLPELQDIVDIRADYVYWVYDETRAQQAPRKHLCNYPFLFDAEAKTMLLQTDQSLQMQTAVQEATQQAMAQLLFSIMPVSLSPVMEIHVSRENIVNDTIRELANFSSRDFKKPLKVYFIGEEAEDAGGVKKEFFLLLLREVLDPKYGMFTSDSESNYIWFSEMTFEDEIMYYLVGLICGLAIYNFTIINLPFPLALYKKLLNENVDLKDLQALSPSLGKGLQDLLDYAEDDLEDVFCLKFELSRDIFGEIRTTELKPNGSDITVTQDNKKEYVDLYVDYVLNASVARHFRAFKDAFHKVCGGRVLQLFHSYELMAVVIGNENYDWDVFESQAEYKGGYSSSDPTIRLFWQVFHELSLEDKKTFLVYLTGTDRVPIQGMKAVKIIIQPTNDEKYLPVAHTCFNLLDLPRYSTKERLRYKLLQAIQQNQGFSLV